MSSKSIFPAAVSEELEKSRVIAVLVIDDPQNAVPLAKSLLDGGINVMELTLRTPAALAALREIKSRTPEMTAGIGTVLTAEQVVAVKQAGAVFGVAPGYNPRVLAKATEVGLPFAPGVCTPSDIEGAAEAGCRILKFFPAEALGGIKTFTSLAAPYAHLGIRYIPLGGINQDNFIDYLENPAILAVGGSWLATRGEINSGAWSAITAKAAAATAAVAAM